MAWGQCPLNPLSFIRQGTMFLNPCSFIILALRHFVNSNFCPKNPISKPEIEKF